MFATKQSTPDKHRSPELMLEELLSNLQSCKDQLKKLSEIKNNIIQQRIDLEQKKAALLEQKKTCEEAKKTILKNFNSDLRSGLKKIIAPTPGDSKEIARIKSDEVAAVLSRQLEQKMTLPPIDPEADIVIESCKKQEAEIKQAEDTISANIDMILKIKETLLARNPSLSTTARRLG